MSFSLLDECPPTSDVVIESAAHGRQRRAERSIDRRDLQAAIRHGTKEPQLRKGQLRWKYSFANVVDAQSWTSDLRMEPLWSTTTTVCDVHFSGCLVLKSQVCRCCFSISGVVVTVSIKIGSLHDVISLVLFSFVM